MQEVSLHYRSHSFFSSSGILSFPFRHQRGITARNLRVGDHWTINMSLACLVCNSVESPSHSFRSYSVSSSDNEGRCSAMANCLIWRPSFPPTHHPSYAASAKVTPQPTISNSNVMDGTPRLVRSRAVRRDLVRDWNFDEVVVVQH
ncbi:unnamed protein product [Citrullus colocynthis]|uniref:Uncharacterized protein n=1 Tax=Citrullus colocynthis TaxID=252529 RepID=A0ABP0XQK1_9ROSI